MKTALIHLVMAASASHAYGFIQSSHLLSCPGKPRVSLPTPLAMANGSKQSDIAPAKAIKQAIEATKTFGATSYKARIAWEVVEKMEYSYQKRNSKQTEKKSDVVAGSTKKTETPRMVIADDATYDAVENNLSDLKLLLDKEMVKVKHLKSMANEIKEVKKKSRPIHGGKSIEAIAAAQEAIREHGPFSSQTALAWEAFEEIVSGELTP
mmetsp:Transcript_1563/g.3346  ORF Transcript_1563/g.3346 Transcript_1563/m.3346 type:complete len:209 (+) Transcript_1563:156-782(+)|eukprot:CAMPEP_0172320856 /NCGR_PEP_ID=MMETSP1058-20130122/41623_1 /TAXON_ID=83371 /ORGANISM="Detonula confervacea, Strain CCMP 353" /LENGTH=208 /DNA_ID=CAMNT_0013036213 /DNA_START=112 /DNA_END=738 /DNA_ORIENTATION=+